MKMFYFLDPTTDEIFGYSEIQVREGHVKPELIEITEDECDDILDEKDEKQYYSEENQTMLKSSFEDEKTSLLEEATMELSILDDLKEVEEDESILDLYKEWKQYRLDVYKAKYKLRPFVSYRRPQTRTLVLEDDFVFPPKPKKYNED